MDLFHDLSFDDKPESLDDLRWRQHRRLPVILPASLETSRGCFDAVILDISLGGARGWLNQSVWLREQAALILARFGCFPAEILCVTRRRAGRFEFRLRFLIEPQTIVQRFSGSLSCAPDSLYDRAEKELNGQRARAAGLGIVQPSLVRH